MFVDRYITAGGQLGNNYNSIFVKGTYDTMFVDRYIIAGGQLGNNYNSIFVRGYT